MYEFNQFANGRFPRTQPREWRTQPFASERNVFSTVLRMAGVILIYAFVLGVSLWAISQQAPSASTYSRGAK